MEWMVMLDTWDAIRILFGLVESIYFSSTGRTGLVGSSLFDWVYNFDGVSFVVFILHVWCSLQQVEKRGWSDLLLHMGCVLGMPTLDGWCLTHTFGAAFRNRCQPPYEWGDLWWTTANTVTKPKPIFFLSDFDFDILILKFWFWNFISRT